MTNRLLPFVSIVLALGIFFAYVSPLWSGKVAEQKAAIAGDVQALSSAKRYVERENQLTEERNAMDPVGLARLEKFLPDSVDNIGLILDLNSLAARSGLNLSSVDVVQSRAGTGSTSGAALPSMPSVANPLGTVDLKMSAVGTYTALQSFLMGMELSQRLLDVRDVTIKNAANGVYTYNITARLYWLR